MGHGAPRDPADGDADPDWDCHPASGNTPEELCALRQGAVARSRSLVAEALGDDGPGRPAHVTWPDGRSPSLRRLAIDMVEEYARHSGHVDLIRESVDGLTGE